MRFRLAPRSLTLDDLEVLVLFNIIFVALICCTFLRWGPSYTRCCCAITL